MWNLKNKMKETYRHREHTDSYCRGGGLGKKAKGIERHKLLVIK